MKIGMNVIRSDLKCSSFIVFLDFPGDISSQVSSVKKKSMQGSKGDNNAQSLNKSKVEKQGPIRHKS